MWKWRGCSVMNSVLVQFVLLRCWKDSAVCKKDLSLLSQLVEKVAMLPCHALDALLSVFAQEHPNVFHSVLAADICGDVPLFCTQCGTHRFPRNMSMVMQVSRLSLRLHVSVFSRRTSFLFTCHGVYSLIRWENASSVFLRQVICARLHTGQSFLV